MIKMVCVYILKYFIKYDIKTNKLIGTFFYNKKSPGEQKINKNF